MVLVAALCEDPSSAVAHAVAPGRCYELGIAYVVFAMWVAGEHAHAVGSTLAEAPSLPLVWFGGSALCMFARCSVFIEGAFRRVLSFLLAGLFQFSVAYALLKPSPETLEVRLGPSV